MVVWLPASGLESGKLVGGSGFGVNLLERGLGHIR